MNRVGGDTDSERMFAFVAREIEVENGDVDRSIRAAVEWLHENVTVHSLNFLPAKHVYGRWENPVSVTSYNLNTKRPKGIGHRNPQGSWMHSGNLAYASSLVVDSVRLDNDPAWTELAPGILLRFDDGLNVSLASL